MSPLTLRDRELVALGAALANPMKTIAAIVIALSSLSLSVATAESDTDHSQQSADDQVIVVAANDTAGECTVICALPELAEDNRAARSDPNYMAVQGGLVLAAADSESIRALFKLTSPPGRSTSRAVTEW